LRRTLILSMASVAVLLLIVLLLVVGWLRSELNSPYYSNAAGETYVDIPRGATTHQIAALLVNAGVLHRRIPFMVYLRYKDLGRRIKAGEYRFYKAATPRQIIQRLAHGDVYFRSITIPEGLTAHEVIDLLAKAGFGEASEFEKEIQMTDWIQDLDPNATTLEGYLFPETYRFGRHVSSEMVIKTMVNEFRTRLYRILQQYPLREGWTVQRIVILASMIEKEVKRPEEGPLVASVLINRLEKGMPLACDATIIYAMKMSGTYRGHLGKADLEMNTPYNSYLHVDLPPGPISNPGAGSIRAALNPSKSDFLYYVSRNDGTHQFSRDLQSHLYAVGKFQKSAPARISRQSPTSSRHR
jgi:UPF0755 protein